MLEVCEKDVALWLRVRGDVRPRQPFHEREHCIGVARLGKADAQWIDL
jgi:hypothetical protein